jgi:hypothetical protein
MKYYALILLIIVLFSSTIFCAEKDSLKITREIYIDAYYASDNSNNARVDKSKEIRPLTLVNSKEDQFSLNIAMLSFKMSYDNLRANLTFHAGDIVDRAYKEQSSVTNPIIQEANIGLNIYDDLWLDAGCFLTHIGYESLTPKDNWLAAQSLLTFYEPNFQAGMRLSYETEKLNVQLYYLNGNGILEDNNRNKSIGSFISYQLSDNFQLFYANIFNNEEDKANKPKRHILNNLGFQYNFNNNNSLKIETDIAYKHNSYHDKDSALTDGIFWGIAAQYKNRLTNNIACVLAFTYIENIKDVYDQYIQGAVYNLGLEYNVNKYSYLRFGLGWYQLSKDSHYFYDKNKRFKNDNLECAVNFGFKFL